MVEDKRADRFTVALNASLPLERSLLEKLHSLNKATQQQWLRSLLIEGWLIECRMLHVACRSAQAAASMGSRPALNRSSKMHGGSLGSTGNICSTSLAPVARAETMSAPLNRDKPLAYLKRVIG